MKAMKRLSALLAAAILTASVSLGGVEALAANTDVDSQKGGSGTITVTNANKGQKYELYRVFEAVPGAVAQGSTDATSVSYKMLSGKNMPDNDYFYVDTAGNVLLKTKTTGEEGSQVTTTPAKGDDGKLTSEAIAWLTSNYLTIGEKVAEGTPAGKGAQKFINLPYGYYYITTTTGTVVSVDTTMPTASIQDKNPATSVDKTITSATAGGTATTDKAAALAEIGSTISYESRIPIKNGAINYKFTDVMSDGLTLDASSVKVYLTTTGTAVATGDTAVASGDDGFGTLTAANKTGTDADITISFRNAWLTSNTGKDIVIQYSATINDSAVVSESGNGNKAKIEYGNTANPITAEDTATVYTAKLTVTKQDGEGNALAGAGFVLKDKTTGKYYRYSANGEAAVEASGTEGEEGYVPAKTAVPAGVSWVDSIDDATEYVTTSGDDGNVIAFKGLDNGTYTLIEKTVPAGYNKADDQDVTIDAATAANAISASNTARTATVTNKAGAEMPETGGIGTTIFYIAGFILVIGAGVILITRRRVNA